MGRASTSPTNENKNVFGLFPAAMVACTLYPSVQDNQIEAVLKEDERAVYSSVLTCEVAMGYQSKIKKDCKSDKLTRHLGK
jgi:hypothetical protein